MKVLWEALPIEEMLSEAILQRHVHRTYLSKQSWPDALPYIPRAIEGRVVVVELELENNGHHGQWNPPPLREEAREQWRHDPAAVTLSQRGNIVRRVERRIMRYPAPGLGDVAEPPSAW